MMLIPAPSVPPASAASLDANAAAWTDQRDDFKFIMAGVHAGKVLTPNVGPGLLHGNFEYAMEAFPFWQSYTPKFQRAHCIAIANSSSISC